ncbi:MAG: hypothetical protein JSW17_05265 [Candidatus Omnitrophota bacterium]|nr:MAG: hypothetical protein JSW17_05265 [Candidatus Omnitrophota bacterium]
MKVKYILLLMVIFIFGCSSAGSHLRSVQSGVGDRITVGKVQREITIGMTAGEVVEVLGSPNIVSTDENRREVWIYDKIATDVSYSASEGGLTLLLLGVGGASRAASKSQRTLTVIIKFDENNMVRDFAYHTSRF